MRRCGIYDESFITWPKHRIFDNIFSVLFRYSTKVGSDPEYIEIMFDLASIPIQSRNSKTVEFYIVPSIEYNVTNG